MPRADQHVRAQIGFFPIHGYSCVLRTMIPVIMPHDARVGAGDRVLHFVTTQLYTGWEYLQIPAVLRASQSNMLIPCCVLLMSYNWLLPLGGK